MTETSFHSKAKIQRLPDIITDWSLAAWCLGDRGKLGLSQVDPAHWITSQEGKINW